MGMLDRYKKKGGFLQLLNLLETSPTAKREHLLSLINQENQNWETELRRKILSFDRILGWNPMTLAEIFEKLHFKTLAGALKPLPTDQVQRAVSSMSTSDQRKLAIHLDELNPTAAESHTCCAKIITELRALVAGGGLKLEKIDPEMAIANNIEEILNQLPDPRIIEKFTQSSSPIRQSFPTENSNQPTKPAVQLKVTATQPQQTSNIDKSHTDETEIYKTRANQLAHENAQLKHEISILKAKLEQFKKSS
jgi:hypothetical protein